MLYFPNKFRIHSVLKCYVIIGTIFVFSAVSCIPLWFYYKLSYSEADQSVHNQKQLIIYLDHTEYSLNLVYRFYFHIYIIILTYVIPLITLMLLNYFLVAFVYQCRKRKHRLGLRERNEFLVTFILIILCFYFSFVSYPHLFCTFYKR